MRTFQLCVLGMVVCVSAVFGPRLAAADDESAASAESSPSIESANVASDDAEALELMDAICPDGVEQRTSGDFDGAVLECNSCPDGASADDGRLRFQTGYIGDFSGDGAKQAIVATTGCGQGFHFRHSTVVADRSSGQWEKAEYRDDINTENCDLVDTSTSHRLLCKTTDVGQGIARTQVSLRGVRDEVLSSATLLELFDNQGACRFEGPFAREVSEKMIDDINGDGRTEIGFVLRTRSGSIADDTPPTDPCKKEEYDIEEEESIRVWSVDTDGISRNSAVERSGLHPEKKDDSGAEEQRDRPSSEQEKDHAGERKSTGGCFFDGGKSDGDGAGIDLCMTDPFQRGF